MPQGGLSAEMVSIVVVNALVRVRGGGWWGDAESGGERI